MPAWKHTNMWTPGMYQKYRKYVETTVPNAPKGVFEGAHEDAPISPSDCSLILLSSQDSQSRFVTFLAGVTSPPEELL
jgi:hypothetical protein